MSTIDDRLKLLDRVPRHECCAPDVVVRDPAVGEPMLANIARTRIPALVAALRELEAHCARLVEVGNETARLLSKQESDAGDEVVRAWRAAVEDVNNPTLARYLVAEREMLALDAAGDEAGGTAKREAMDALWHALTDEEIAYLDARGNEQGIAALRARLADAEAQIAATMAVFAQDRARLVAAGKALLAHSATADDIARWRAAVDGKE